MLIEKFNDFMLGKNDQHLCLDELLTTLRNTEASVDGLKSVDFLGFTTEDESSIGTLYYIYKVTSNTDVFPVVVSVGHESSHICVPKMSDADRYDLATFLLNYQYLTSRTAALLECCDEVLSEYMVTSYIKL